MLASIEMNMHVSTLICIYIYHLQVKWLHLICLFQEETDTEKKGRTVKIPKLIISTYDIQYMNHLSVHMI